MVEGGGVGDGREGWLKGEGWEKGGEGGRDG